MLKLKNIKKDYESGDSVVQALKGLNIEFRDSEFVSILGQSGCGKTTLLNIIGGLDKYTSGDLIINGKSTKEYVDSDWDTYRNHSIGFVFQSYNLIPHQTVLSNVELALTLSGVSKEERRKRAVEVLTKVGLGDQINKKPNQMSGGQMQRVAIARALVNDPDILLADEPTGALDSTTSKQVMEILKEISKDKLIIMVTHNSEIAEKYSSRIVKLLDGEVIDDTNPYTDKESKKDKKAEKKKGRGKTSMNFFTALALSTNNLLTKKGRTLLTAFAGSIGIIGIALILSLSTVVQNYISSVEEGTLSSYPIVIEESTVDMGDMLSSLMQDAKDEEAKKESGKIYSENIIGEMLSSLSAETKSNNLVEFKKYLDVENNEIRKNSNDIKYNYGLNIDIFGKNKKDNEYIQVNPSQVMSSIGMADMTNSPASSFMPMTSFVSMDAFTEVMDNQTYLDNQHDVLAGNWPKEYNEVVLIVDEEEKISDYTLYTLGLKDQKELSEKMESIEKGQSIDEGVKTEEYTYDELLGLTFKAILPSDYYEKENNLWIDKSENKEYMNKKLESAENLKVVGIVKINEESVTGGGAQGLIGYTSKLQEHIINKTNESKIVEEQKANPNVNIFTGLPFNTSNASIFDYKNLTNEEKAYMTTLNDQEIAALMATYSANTTATYESNLKTLGAADLEVPTKISIYPVNFESKKLIEDEIKKYNDDKKDIGKEEDTIRYSDLVGTMMASVTSIVNVISYVLIAFVAISLVVSSIMIGIITYISVLERTKEIGILRSIGASKKDISRVFNAETFIVGLVAGLLGIGITALLTIPINIIIKAVVGISNVAMLPIGGAIILVVISMLLTVFAGLIPARMASKKDPVIALRTD